jgi:16S rRNA G527 N7-methylase RsmG
VVDLVTARAVAALPKLAGWVAPLVRAGGHLVTFKGSRVEEELEAWGRSPGPWGLARVEREAIPGLTLVALRRADGP